MASIFLVFLTLLAWTITQGISQATEVTNNAPGSGYWAVLNGGPGPVRGTIVGTAATNGIGVLFDVSLTGFDFVAQNSYSECFRGRF